MTITPKTLPRDTDAAVEPRRWRDWLLLGGLGALVIFGLIGLAAATGWQETLNAVASLSLQGLAILLLLSLVNYGFRGLRWHMFARQLGLSTTFGQNMLQFLGGFAMSVTPGRVGELVRMRWIGRTTGWSFERTAPLVLVDRAADLSAMAILLAFSVGLSSTGIAGAAPVAVLGLAAAFVVTRPILLHRLAGLFHRASGRRFPRLFGKVRRAATSLKAFTAPSALLVAGALGTLGWMAEGYAFYLLLNWMGADVGFWTAIGVFIFATLAGGLTGAPGGLGGAEVAMVALLILYGVPAEVAGPATLVIRLTTLWFAIGIGLILFPFAERNSKRAQPNALET